MFVDVCLIELCLQLVQHLYRLEEENLSPTRLFYCLRVYVHITAIKYSMAGHAEPSFLKVPLYWCSWL